nr:classical arabinogalactan protein 9-like [Procambarus clarkii]
MEAAISTRRVTARAVLPQEQCNQETRLQVAGAGYLRQVAGARKLGVELQPPDISSALSCGNQESLSAPTPSPPTGNAPAAKVDLGSEPHPSLATLDTYPNIRKSQQRPRCAVAPPPPPPPPPPVGRNRFSCEQKLISSTDYPEPLADYPEPLADYPEPLADYPEPLADYPEPLADYPEPLADYPEPLADYPEPLADYPEPLADYPEPLADYPEPLADYPEPLAYYPEPLADYPEPLADYPGTGAGL